MRRADWLSDEAWDEQQVIDYLMGKQLLEMAEQHLPARQQEALMRFLAHPPTP